MAYKDKQKEKDRQALRRKNPQYKAYQADWRKRNQKRAAASRRDWFQAHPQYVLWKNARDRAIERGLPFNIDKSDIVIPDECPILHIKLTPGGNRDYSPSLDRIIPEKGYVKGNIQVISGRANRIKSDATLDELERIVENLRSYR